MLEIRGDFHQFTTFSVSLRKEESIRYIRWSLDTEVDCRLPLLLLGLSGLPYPGKNDSLQGEPEKSPRN